MKAKSILIRLSVILLLLAGVGCSTTKRLGEGEVLYTGVKKVTITPQPGEKLPDALVGELKKTIDVKPNNPMPFLSPYVRTPFPIGLWVYNNWNPDSKGLKGWLYRNLVAKPVLISDVRPAIRNDMMEKILDDNGYFGSTAHYELLYDKKNPKMARISYSVNVSEPYPIDSIIYIDRPENSLTHFIDSLARLDKYLQPGSIFCVDSLSDVRIKITNRLRNRGYYYFRPEYIEFLADSLITPHHITIKLDLDQATPEIAMRQFKVGRVITTIERRSTRDPGTPDTTMTNRGELVVYEPAHLRKSIIPGCITFREGRLFSVRDMDRTQERLSRLGIFGSVQIQPFPADTTAGGAEEMDVLINCRFDRPMEASVEVNATSKSNSYIGPGVIFGLTHNNVFGGAERLSLQLTGSYEWQTGRGANRSIFNSYEFGLTASLAFPRLLAPNFIKRRQRDLNWTTVSLGADLLNRPHYFKMAELNAGFSYDWKPTRNTSSTLTLFKLTYNKLMSTTEEFDSIMNLNPSVALSFQSQFIPQLSYTYTLDKFLEKEQINGITFTGQFTEAGNIFDGIWSIFQRHGEKKMFGTPFSQFIKGQVQLVYNRRLFPHLNQWIVSRVLIGAEHAYGNSREVPYSEQFYIGGANSIRAFTVRSIGPGSYRPPKSQRDSYFDQTGTFKLEMNVEYRFPIVSILHGAAFVDAGNIWLLKKDPLRPGGLLTGKTFLRDIALGTGVGLRVDIGVMVIRGDLGYGLHVPYADAGPHYFNIPFKKAFAFHLAIGYPF
ncbi:MAG: BamA/TamA family outer membrane protein [Muribaculaceae bacterium]|nr:BamA/TamA family outer membrane protein [Muribaculaceae bacterium]